MEAVRRVLWPPESVLDALFNVTAIPQDAIFPTASPTFSLTFFHARSFSERVGTEREETPIVLGLVDGSGAILVPGIRVVDRFDYLEGFVRRKFG